jgi:hypothetical protein
VFLSALAMAGALSAGPAQAAYETQQGTVDRIEVNAPAASSRNVVVWLNGVSPMCNRATNNTTGYFNRADMPDVFDSMLSVFMTAQSLGKAVTVLVEDGASGCRIDRVQMMHQ